VFGDRPMQRESHPVDAGRDAAAARREAAASRSEDQR
jgi:hypothetical protein